MVLLLIEASNMAYKQFVFRYAQFRASSSSLAFNEAVGIAIDSVE